MANIPKKGNKKGAPPPPTVTPSNLDKISSPGRTKTMNLKVEPEFHREYKRYALEIGKSMVELLEESFYHYRKCPHKDEKL